MVGYLILRWCIILSCTYVVVKSLISVLICCYLVVLNKTPIVCCPGYAFKNKLNLISSCPKSYLGLYLLGCCFYCSLIWSALEGFVGLHFLREFLCSPFNDLKVDVLVGSVSQCCGPLCKAWVFLLLICSHCIYANAFVGCQPMPMCLSLARVDHH